MTEIIKQEIDELHETVKDLLQQGMAEEAIIKKPAKENIDAFYAQTIIDNVLSDRQDKKDFWKLLLPGLFTIAAGLLINYFSYTIADNAGSFTFFYFGVLLLPESYY